MMEQIRSTSQLSKTAHRIKKENGVTRFFCGLHHLLYFFTALSARGISFCAFYDKKLNLIQLVLFLHCFPEQPALTML